MDYYFEWDERKEKRNRFLHTISFERASSIFRDPRALTIFDEEHSAEEDRWITLGIDRTGILIVDIEVHPIAQKDFIPQNPYAEEIRATGLKIA